ncbi:hypothetical protein [Actinophytocola sp.]|uniref:hypothetical protein n=1 Tax=Actinophytocola sp. TaxID=1872138 RepID=UPI003D6A2DDF
MARLIGGGCQSLITLPQAATVTTHTYAPGDAADHAAGILSWLRNLTAFLDDVDRRFQSSGLPNHRFAHAWTPTCVMEGLGFDLPIYELPASRQAVLGSNTTWPPLACGSSFSTFRPIASVSGVSSPHG